MRIQDKFDTILKTNKLGIKSIYGLETFCKVGVGSVSKFLNENKSPTLGTIKKIQEALSINTDWWDTGKGEIYLGKPTHEPKGSDNTENLQDDQEKVMHGIAETISEYRLVHRAVLNEEYRIVLKTELEEKNALLKEVVESKNALIIQLKNEIKKHLEDIDRLTSGQSMSAKQAK